MITFAPDEFEDARCRATLMPLLFAAAAAAMMIWRFRLAPCRYASDCRLCCLMPPYAYFIFRRAIFACRFSPKHYFAAVAMLMRDFARIDAAMPRCHFHFAAMPLPPCRLRCCHDDYFLSFSRIDAMPPLFSLPCFSAYANLLLFILTRYVTTAPIL